MLYSTYTIGGELMHSSKGNDWKKHKYMDKIKTATGKIRYIYKTSSPSKIYRGIKRTIKYTKDFKKNAKSLLDKKLPTADPEERKKFLYKNGYKV